MAGMGEALILFGAVLILIAMIGSVGRRASITKSGITGPVDVIVLVIGVIVYLIEGGYLVLPT